MSDPSYQMLAESADQPDTGSLVYVYVVSFVAALGGLLFGFDTGVISGAIPFITKHFSLNAHQEGFAVSSLLVGCIIGAGFAGMLSDRFGRKKILIGAALFFMVSAILSALPRTMMELVFARFIGGLAVGVASMLSPMYIAEISPARIRGRLVSVNQFAIVGGILLSYFTNWLLVDTGAANWRWMLFVETLPALMFFIGLLFIPESPRFLIKQGRHDAALAILKKVGGRSHAELELSEIKVSLTLEEESFRELLRPGLRTLLLIGVLLAIFQQITGINIILYYAPKIFMEAGFGESSALLASVIVGLTNMLCTIIAILTVDRLGRKPLLLIGLTGMGISLFLVGLAFHQSMVGTSYVLIPIIAYVGFFAMSLGPVVWVLMSEIFPTKIRGRAMSIATMVLWISCFAVAQTFPLFLEKLGEKTFFMYAIVSALAFIFVWSMVIETKGKSLEEIEKIWVQ